MLTESASVNVGKRISCVLGKLWRPSRHAAHNDANRRHLHSRQTSLGLVRRGNVRQYRRWRLPDSHIRYRPHSRSWPEHKSHKWMLTKQFGCRSQSLRFGQTVATNGHSPRRGWQDDQGELVRYNLAFINHFLCGVENGRVLGYDNSHGFHHRDCKGSVTSFTYLGHDVLLDRFLAEAADLRKDKA